jgi:hypothetical protein
MLSSSFPSKVINVDTDRIATVTVDLVSFPTSPNKLLRQMQGPQPSEQHQSSEALNAQSDPAKEEAREARETLKKEWDEAIRKTKPRDTAAGLKSGLATAAAGVASGVVGLFAAPIVGAKQDGASGFAKGLATGNWGP